MKFRSTTAAAACIIALASSLTGCATPAKSDAMVAEPVAIAHTSSSDVSVVVSGGKTTSSMGASQVSDDAFQQALSDSITKSGVFQSR
jgi:hypothetical protein